MKIKIDSHTIGNKERTFIIAELSANHGNDINIAKKTILAAKEVGADAIKIQTFTPDTITLDCDNDYFTVKGGTIWDGRTLYDLYEEAHMPWEWQKELKEYANSIGLIFFSSPFDKSAVDFLESINVPAYKIASYEIMDIPLIEYTASKGKPMIISTGVASLNDIQEAVEACNRVGNDQIILLKCTSSYPAKIEDANLNTIPNMKETFGVEVGLSDHTLGITVPVLSIALGANVIEKHFILDRSVGGPDSSFSLEPQQFKEMVDSVRDAEKALGKVDYTMSEKKKNNRLLGRSLFVVKDIKAGDKFTEDNVKSIRPGNGLPPKHYNEIINRKAATDIERGTPLSWDIIK
ncbi:Spore coat polysaccharide biosynthesis protein spsE [Aerococcus viridans]|uniref:Pseudaminic acid synthase n=2 Tax=Aerococcus viridans TaxID=1377 RepID=A0AAU8UMN5_9LACT|nr:pseudaminic acid synthase [Aerococcus viridans]AMC01341.1 pseudaminic acid synthase [Aerococcus viridans]EFG50207.1 pseudaminic acid synthase [Aerococcus viridans ATCC 11563 = CCUG 4311]SUU15960.1 Spore coat polysaccharide biosynthesis protein spsE [Aerococcus viridans]